MTTDSPAFLQLARLTCRPGNYFIYNGAFGFRDAAAARRDLAAARAALGVVAKIDALRREYIVAIEEALAALPSDAPGAAAPITTTKPAAPVQRPTESKMASAETRRQAAVAAGDDRGVQAAHREWTRAARHSPGWAEYSHEED